LLLRPAPGGFSRTRLLLFHLRGLHAVYPVPDS
jgi:hypothetical protein